MKLTFCLQRIVPFHNSFLKYFSDSIISVNRFSLLFLLSTLFTLLRPKLTLQYSHLNLFLISCVICYFFAAYHKNAKNSSSSIVGPYFFFFQCTLANYFQFQTNGLDKAVRTKFSKAVCPGSNLCRGHKFL